MTVLTKQVHLLVLLWLVTETGFAQERAADSLFVSVYHDEEISLLNDLPEVFPRHRPAKLLLKCQSRVPARATILQIADSLAAMQKLVGLPYYSHTEKKMKTLFEVSEVLAHPRSSKASADPLFHELPLDTTIYIRQVDNRLGTVIYRTEIKASGEQVTFCASNLVPLKKFGLQLAEVGDCILLIAIQKEDGYLDFTAWQWLRFKGGLLGAFVKEESFANRLKAVAGFYVKTIATK